MENVREHLKDISEIRALMERSSKFLSLSGLAGISAGLIALIGAAVAWIFLENPSSFEYGYGYGSRSMTTDVPVDFLLFFFLDAGLVLVGALGCAAFFSWRLATKKDLPIWNQTTRHLLVSLMVPLMAGGLFCLIQLFHDVYIWVAATTLIFYGLALLNASKYTLKEIQFLGVSEIILGLACAVWVGQGLLFWALGFGVLHILYGAIMYFKYER